jgi:HEAT repeat protein
MIWLTRRRLTSADAQTRWDAALELGRARDLQSVDALLKTLRDPDAGVRTAAISALVMIGDTRAIQPFLSALQDRDADVVKAAVAGLGGIGDGSAIEPLARMLGGSHSFEVQKALDGIDREWRRSPGARQAVASFLRDLASHDRKVQSDAARALGILGDPSAVDPLIACLRSRDAFVRGSAAKSLGALRDRRAVKPLLALIVPGSVSLDVLGALGALGDPSATASLVAVMREEPAALDALGGCGDAQAIPPLIAFIRDPPRSPQYWNNPQAQWEEQGVRRRPVEALEKILARDAASASTADLETLAGMADLEYHGSIHYDTPGYGDGSDDFFVRTDLSLVRQRARDELTRRAGSR